MHSVELFAGVGGLAMGMTSAGFQHSGVIEFDRGACETIRHNQRRHVAFVEEWPLYEVDAREFDYASLEGPIDVISGGPPCQPFSTAGKHTAQGDDRNMFPEAIRAVRELRPKAFVFENVRGLARESFGLYFSYLQLQLQYPDLQSGSSEGWRQHRARLGRHHTANKGPATYNVVWDVLNAADYGVPQKRERVFIVGFQSNLGVRWSFPEPTHSEDALLSSKWITREYWDHHRIPKKRLPKLPVAVVRAIERIRSQGSTSSRAPWRTVRDAISDLPDVRSKHHPIAVSNHVRIFGARSYPGHTGSRLDEPAKTVKAGAHGVPGGENMVVLSNGSVRYFTVRELARLQTFPDEYEFSGYWGHTMKQLGNAVPLKLADLIGRSIAESLRQQQMIRIAA